MKPEFLDWNRPLLHIVADYLVERYVKDGRFNMQGVVLALPGRRAINRLEELLVDQAAMLADAGKIEPDWYPPEFLTLGTLPECFYERTKPIADDLTQRLAWIKVIDRMAEKNPDMLAKVLPHPPRQDDLDSRLMLGKMFARLHRELSADALDFSKVVVYCRKLNIGEEAARWDVLAKLQQFYLDLLDSLEIWDLQSARLFAIENQKPDEMKRIIERLKAEGKHFFLVGLVDMNRAQRKILKKFERFVTPLVLAPPSLRNRFDEFGCLNIDAWGEASLEIDNAQIEIVHGPEQQAAAVLRKIDSLRQRFAASELVVGVPDPQVLPYLRQRMDQAGLKSRHFEGTPLRQTSVYRFLEVLQNFCESGSFSSFAGLLRHPNVETFLRNRLASRQPTVPQSTDNSSVSPDNQMIDILSDLDRYYTEHLPSKADAHWAVPNETKTQGRCRSEQTLRAVWPILVELLGMELLSQTDENQSSGIRLNRNDKLPVELRTIQIQAILDRLYQDNEERLVVEARKQVDVALQTLVDAPPICMPKIDFPDTLRLLMQLIQSGNIPPFDDEGVIELVGWLEIVMDDAPIAMITGMNDGFVPSFSTSDAFLPDKLRQYLGIEDNRRRFARDAYSLSVILATRCSDDKRLDEKRLIGEHFQERRCKRTAAVQLIGGRHSVEGDPMLPSRLFFSTDDLTVARRVRRFFAEQEDNRPIRLAGTPEINLTTAELFRVPPPLPNDKQPQGPPTSMRVTEFADYVRCPYRYYLKHRLGLNNLDDSAEELDGARFGTLIHEVVQKFSQGEFAKKADKIIKETEPEKLRKILKSLLRNQLKGELYRYASVLYGEHPQPAVAIQLERAEQRLNALADWEADWRLAGNQTLAVEFNIADKGKKVALQVDGRPMFLRGRIDRIDYNADEKRLIVLDYKTSDSAAKPEKTHQKKNENGVLQWIDFQLPLYHYIMEQSCFGSDRYGIEEISLGYITLPKDVEKVQAQIASWNRSEIDEAIEQAREIVRNIWNNQYDPVSPPPQYSEAFAAICLDNILK